MMVKGLACGSRDGAFERAGGKGMICSSGAFMTTRILSDEQLRDAKARLQASLTVSTVCAQAMLHLSSHLTTLTDRQSSSRLKIVVMSTGIGSCKSRTTFAPSSFGISELITRTSGI